MKRSSTTAAPAARAITGTDPPPLRIALGLHSLLLGGSQINTVDIARALRSNGHDVVLFAFEHQPNVSVVPIIQSFGLTLEVLRSSGGFFSQAREMTALVDRHDVQVVHVFHEDGALGPTAAIALRARPGRALVITNYMMHTARWLPPHASLVVGTEGLRKESERQRPGPVTVLEPPVDVARDQVPEGASHEFRQRHDVDDDDVLAVIVSRIDRTMKLDGIRLTLRAVEALDCASLKLVLVGDGEGASVVRGLAEDVNRRLGRSCVTLAGAMHDPRPAYGAADIVLGMGGAALRGLAFGKPVIVLGERTFARTFSPETLAYFLEHGFYGSDDRDVDGRSLTRQIDALLDPTQRASLGQFGRQTIRQRFSLERAARTLEGVYLQALGDAPGTITRWADIAYLLAYDAAHKHLPTSIRHSIRARLARGAASLPGPKERFG